jgi:hypothetical protein
MTSTQRDSVAVSSSGSGCTTAIVPDAYSSTTTRPRCRHFHAFIAVTVFDVRASRSWARRGQVHLGFDILIPRHVAQFEFADAAEAHHGEVPRLALRHAVGPVLVEEVKPVRREEVGRWLDRGVELSRSIGAGAMAVIFP